MTGSEPWVASYRGLFGLDTHDRLGGERSPAGPRFTRGGDQRLSWYDPLGFAGLDKEVPPLRRSAALRERQTRLDTEREMIERRIDELMCELPGISLEAHELAADAGLARAYARQAVELGSGEAELRTLRARQAALEDQLVATQRALGRSDAADAGDARAHLVDPQRPAPPEDTRIGPVLELWSAVSVAAMLIIVAGLIGLGIVEWWVAPLIAFGGYVVAESIFRRRLLTLILRVIAALAIVTILVVAWAFREEAMLLSLIGLALLVLSGNVREVIRR